MLLSPRGSLSRALSPRGSRGSLSRVLSPRGSKNADAEKPLNEVGAYPALLSPRGSVSIAESGSFGSTTNYVRIPPSPTSPVPKSQARNLRRVQSQMEEDRNTVGKSNFLLSSLFDPPILLSDDAKIPPPSWLWSAIKEVYGSAPRIPTAPPFKFEFSTEAASYNTNLLRDFEFDLGRFISHHRGSIHDYGSEFRDVTLLSKIYRQHPNFRYLSEILRDGMSYKFTKELDENQRLNEVNASLQ